MSEPKQFAYYRCKRCAETVKVPQRDLKLFLRKVAANDGAWRFGVHECDEEGMGLTELIGGRFFEYPDGDK